MGDISRHFSSKELGCKCGCGYCNPAAELVMRLEEFRANCGNRPVYINSCCRCVKHNAAVGGAKNSQHVKGYAADIKKFPDMSVDEMARIAEQTGFGGIGKYNWGIHVDIRKIPARWDYRKK